MKHNEQLKSLQNGINYIDTQIKQVTDMIHVMQRQLQMYQEQKLKSLEQIEKINESKRKLKWCTSKFIFCVYSSDF